MNRYTIFCTDEQTKKAVELGAPITIHPFETSIIKANEKLFHDLIFINNNYYLIPTAEQMAGWLEKQGFEFYTCKPIDTWIVEISNDDFFATTQECATRKEAILAAIDVALNYLIEIKNSYGEYKIIWR